MSAKSKTKPKKVFISYCWTNDEYKKNVLKLAEWLRSKGVDVILDQWDLKPGDDMNAFMEQSIKKADKVLVLCNKEYVKKADSRSGGSGIETSIITPDVYGKIRQRKYIPIVVDSFKVMPTYLKGRLAINLKSSNGYEDLLRSIFDRWSELKPDLGITPEWADDYTDSDNNIRISDTNTVVLNYDPSCLIRPVVGIGQNHAIAVFSNGLARAVGLNEDFQCNVNSWHNIVSVIGCWKGSIGLQSDGTCVATGKNVIEDGTLFRWKNIIALASGTYHILGLKKDGTVASFGRNPSGQCDVENWKNVIGIAAGRNHSVGLFKDKTVVAVGSNDQGQCEVQRWKDVKQIAAAGDHTLALLTDGSVVGCGNMNSIKLEVLKGVKAIATGDFHAVGLKEDGCVLNTGADISGLSDVERWHNIIAISADFSASIGVRSDGKVFITHDRHNSYYLNAGRWKLFDDDNADKLISQFDYSLSEFKLAVHDIKNQLLRVIPFINEYHDNVKILDFSLFDEEYKKLNSLVSIILHLRESCQFMPTILSMISLLLTSAIDADNTIEERDGLHFITEKSYDAFTNFLLTLNILEPEIRLVEEGISFPDLVEQQITDFSPLIKNIPTWR